MGFSYACKEVVTQMASRIQGITVEIGGDTTKLSKALESVNKSIKGTQSGLKDVNKLLNWTLPMRSLNDILADCRWSCTNNHGNCSLQSIADSLDLNPIKIRKLLITTGVYFPSTAAKLFCCSSKGKRTFTLVT